MVYVKRAGSQAGGTRSDRLLVRQGMVSRGVRPGVRAEHVSSDTRHPARSYDVRIHQHL